MLTLFLYFIIIIIIIIITIMYLKSIQIHNQETKYQIVMRFLLIILITIIFLEQKNQTIILSKVSGTIQTYMYDAGKTIIEFLDNKTKDISNRLTNIDNKLDSIDEDISLINNNMDNTRESVSKKIDSQKYSIINELKNYFDIKINQWIESIIPLGPGGIKTIW